MDRYDGRGVTFYTMDAATFTAILDAYAPAAAPAAPAPTNVSYTSTAAPVSNRRAAAFFAFVFFMLIAVIAYHVAYFNPRDWVTAFARSILMTILPGGRHVKDINEHVPSTAYGGAAPLGPSTAYGAAPIPPFAALLKRRDTTDARIREMFAALRAYVPKIINAPYTIRNNPALDTRFAPPPPAPPRHMLIINPNSSYDDYDQISDMFQEENRLKCRVGRNPSPYEFYTHSAAAVDRYAAANKVSPREALWKLTRECTSHRPNILSAINKILGPFNTMLDFSAGWGDRLVSAMANEINYVGIDPNPDLFGPYGEMITFFAPKTAAIMVNATIQAAEIPLRYYDLIFTSPPYFNLELYAVNDPAVAAGSERRWFDSFLAVALAKSWRYLDIGFMAINISQKTGEHYITWMIAYAATLPGAAYRGVIGYAKAAPGGAGFAPDSPQPVHIWEKTITTPRLALRKFRRDDIPHMAEIGANPANMKEIAQGKTWDAKMAAKTITKWMTGDYPFYPICAAGGAAGAAGAAGAIVGFIGYYDGQWLDPAMKDKMLLRIVIDAPHRRRGYAAEILARFAAHVIAKYGAVYSLIDAANAPSIALHLKLGFKKRGAYYALRG